LTRQRFFEFFVNFVFGAVLAFSIFFTFYIFFALLSHGVLTAILSAIFAFFIGSMPLLFLETYMALQEVKYDNKKQNELLQELLRELKSKSLDENEPDKLPNN
jgi:ABC-type bacteriocin/lantibiotic exporter with double-glycine peptidase domain